MIWVRIDNRLIHGQIIEAWLPYLDARRLAVVNDSLAVDRMRQEIMRLAISERVAVDFIPMKQALELYAGLAENKAPALLLVEDCHDARRLLELGVPMTLLNVGNMHYAAGKRQICPHAAVSESDLNCLRELAGQGVRLDFRSVPSDNPVVEQF